MLLFVFFKFICFDESYLRCFCLCILYGWKLLEMLSFGFFKFICFDESYLRCFCFCLKCLEFLHKKIIILIIICSDNLNIYTTHTIKCTVWPVWPNGWAFVYELSGSGFNSICSHLSFRFRACFEKGVPWHSDNYTVWIHSEMCT